MLSNERRQHILELIEKNKSVSVADLGKKLDVSEMTIRRDLRILSNEGLIMRVHGGAVVRSGRSYEPPFITRSMDKNQIKEAIGRQAAKLVEEGDSITIDVGTTTLEFAKNIIGIPNLTILTSSLPIANILADTPNIRLILSGGILRQGEHSMIGHIAQSTYENFQVDKAFIGIGGIHLERGLTEYNVEDSLIKKTIIQNVEQVIVLADSSKLNRTCFTMVAPLSEMDILISDWEMPLDIVDELERRGVEVILAPKPDN